MNDEPTYPPASFVKAHLLRDPLYLEDGPLWEELLRTREGCAAWFAEVGLDLVVDEDEGYAFVRQPDVENEEYQGPRLIVRRKLGYEATLLLVCLRQELARTEAQDADQTRVVRTRREISELVSGFLAETHDETRDLKKIDKAVEQLVALGFLKRLGGDGGEDYEVRRIIKARLGPSELEDIKRKLISYEGE
jgi:hypothetical protein